MLIEHAQCKTKRQRAETEWKEERGWKGKGKAIKEKNKILLKILASALSMCQLKNETETDKLKKLYYIITNLKVHGDLV
jgi:hypothetical protein